MKNQTLFSTPTIDVETGNDTILRHADARQSAEVLKALSEMRLDIVAPARNVVVQDGRVMIAGLDDERVAAALSAVLGDEIPAAGPFPFIPSNSAIGDMCARYDMPVSWIRKMYTDLPRVSDTAFSEHFRTDRKRSFTFRSYLKRGAGSFFPEHMTPEQASAIGRRNGLLRAVLSDRYSVIDNIDLFFAVLAQLTDLGVGPQDLTVDLSDRNFFMRFRTEQISAQVPELLAFYKGRFGTGSDDPRLFAGLEIRNSEIGNAAVAIVPRIVVKVCDNGLVRTQDVVRQTHLGARLESGLVDWSGETHRKNLDLTVSMLGDAVRQFLQPDYLVRVARETIEAGGIEVPEPQKTIERVAEHVGLSDGERTGVLDAFYAGINGGDKRTRFDVSSAITAHAQTTKSADRQGELETAASEILFGKSFSWN